MFKANAGCFLNNLLEQKQIKRNKNFKRRGSSDG
jgi:hypothetical protein